MPSRSLSACSGNKIGVPKHLVVAAQVVSVMFASATV